MLLSAHFCTRSSFTFDRVALSAIFQRVDSVLESSLREIIGSKNFTLFNLSLKFCETTIYDNKVFIENLVAVRKLYMKLLSIFRYSVPVAFQAIK